MTCSLLNPPSMIKFVYICEAAKVKLPVLLQTQRIIPKLCVRLKLFGRLFYFHVPYFPRYRLLVCDVKAPPWKPSAPFWELCRSFVMSTWLWAFDQLPPCCWRDKTKKLQGLPQIRTDVWCPPHPHQHKHNTEQEAVRKRVGLRIEMYWHPAKSKRLVAEQIKHKHYPSLNMNHF